MVTDLHGDLRQVVRVAEPSGYVEPEREVVLQNIVT